MKEALVRMLLLACLTMVPPIPAKQHAQVKVSSEKAKVTLETAKVANLYGYVNGTSYRRFEKEMLETAGLPGDRLVIINSPGGLVEWGQKMIDLMAIEQARGVKVTCLVQKNAHSMAFNFLTRCNVRLATPGASFLVHKVSYIHIHETHTRRLTAKELRKSADQLDRDDEPYRQANAAAMHLSLADYDLFADMETYWTDISLMANGYLHGIGVQR